MTVTVNLRHCHIRGVVSARSGPRARCVGARATDTHTTQRLTVMHPTMQMPQGSPGTFPITPVMNWNWQPMEFDTNISSSEHPKTLSLDEFIEALGKRPTEEEIAAAREKALFEAARKRGEVCPCGKFRTLVGEKWLCQEHALSLMVESIEGPAPLLPF